RLRLRGDRPPRGGDAGFHGRAPWREGDRGGRAAGDRDGLGPRDATPARREVPGRLALRLGQHGARRPAPDRPLPRREAQTRRAHHPPLQDRPGERRVHRDGEGGGGARRDHVLTAPFPRTAEEARMARLGPFVIRLALGVIFFAHGAQKMLGWWGGAGFSGTVEAFTKQGMPAPMAMLVIAAEFFGGLGVFFGCLTRLAAFGIAAVMTGAIFLVHIQNGFFLNWFNVPGKGHGFECNLGYLAMAASLMLTGAGPVSIDALRGGKRTDLDAGRERASRAALPPRRSRVACPAARGIDLADRRAARP